MKMILQIEAGKHEIPELIRGIATMGLPGPIVFNLVDPGDPLEAMGLEKKKEPVAKTTKIRSRTKRGVVYVVTNHTDGNYSCDCPAWKHNVTRPCKHIFEAKTNPYAIWEDKRMAEPIVAGTTWVRAVRSTKNPHKFYEVRGVGQTAIACTCPDHVHREHKCKHMVAVEASLDTK